MNKLLVLVSVACGVFAIVVPTFTVPEYPDYVGIRAPITVFDTSLAVLLCVAVALVIGRLISHSEIDARFLVHLFMAALLIRILVGVAIFSFNGQTFFGGDTFTYDALGYLELRGWHGDHYSQVLAAEIVNKPGTGWGMVYFVAGIYQIVGRNLLAVQLVNAVLGAAIAPLIFLSTWIVFNNSRASRLAAIGVAFMPSLVLWSSQGLKDGPIMFFLALAILATLRLGQKFSVRYVTALIAALLCILAFRFYVFYMLFASIGAALLIGMRTVSAQGLVRQILLTILLGLTLTYFGLTRHSFSQLRNFGALEAVQISRIDASNSAQSGFARDTDVSTVRGAVFAVPRGLIYLLFAPFPWELGSLRQTITLPEMVVWWASFPMLVLGLWFSIKYRLRQVLPILLFTILLSLAYSVYQGNVGNAYRERAQLLMFYFIFTAVGYVLIYEKRNRNQGELTVPQSPRQM